ncbi:hypothetical protein NFI96_013263 [Prochilodus magdalenae]|nr:hypothetical protein NFI96_013263 [Prochilodus magdalenae]
MELRVTGWLLLLVCAVIFTATEGFIPQCCTKYSTDISCHILRKVERYDKQEAGGSCDIVALALHMNNKIYCADPKYTEVLKMPKYSYGKWIQRCKKMIKKMNRNKFRRQS